MKSCVFSEMIVVSFKEKKARRVAFHPRTTTIVGENDTGKSALLKTLYWTFGAEPAKNHDTWRSAQIASLVRFQLDGAAYAMLRQFDQFWVFDSRGTTLGTFRSVTNELGPYLAKLFEFGLVANSRAGETFTPPPAFMLLPFYIDQDKGWSDNWASFRSLQQLPRHRDVLAEFHSGLRPNEYYRTRVSVEQREQELAERRNELRALDAARERVDQKFPFQGFDIDVDAFRADIDRLLTQSDQLRKAETRYRKAVQDAREQKAVIEMQMALVQREHRELRADFEYATSLPGRLIECPVCSTLHENSFAERFAIARDEDRCRDLLLQLQADLAEVEQRISKATADLLKSTQAREALDRTLATKRGALQLRDVVTAEGRKEVQRVFAENRDDYLRAIRALETTIEALAKTLRAYEDKNRRVGILDFYHRRMTEYLRDLEVHNLRPKSYRSISARVNETGSDQPRALLAYYFAFLDTMLRYAQGTCFPIVIDEPNQQGLDPETLPRVLRFIYDKQPPSTQLILGVENLHGVAPKGDVVRLNRKLSVLAEDQFESLAEIVRPLLRDSFTLEPG